MWSMYEPVDSGVKYKPENKMINDLWFINSLSASHFPGMITLNIIPEEMVSHIGEIISWKFESGSDSIIIYKPLHFTKLSDHK